MIKPRGLPSELIPLKNKVIDYLYGRLAAFPPNLLPLLEWLSHDDCLLGTEAEEALGLNIYALRQKCFEDSELADWEGLDEEDITDELRVNFARERMESAFETDESLVESIQGALLTNEEGEEAYICAVFESHGQGGMEINHWAYVKTFKEFLDRIREKGSLVLLDDIQSQSDQDILKHWKIHGALPNSPEGLTEELIPIRDGAIDFALGRTKSEPEGIEKLYEWVEFEGHPLLQYIDWGFEYPNVAYAFNDEELSATIDIDVEHLTDEMRISFARERLAKEFNDEGHFAVVQTVISNENREKAFLGMLMGEGGMGESGFTHMGIYKNKEDFLKSLENSDWFVSISDEEKITDEYILESWGKY